MRYYDINKFCLQLIKTLVAYSATETEVLSIFAGICKYNISYSWIK